MSTATHPTLERARFRHGRPPAGAYQAWARRCAVVAELAGGLGLDTYTATATRRGSAEALRLSLNQRRDWRRVPADEADRHAEQLAAAAALLAAGPPNLPSPGRFRTLVAAEGEETVDGRIVDENALDWRDLPLALMFQTENNYGHAGARFAGWFDAMTRDGAEVWGEGPFDGGTEGVEAARIVRDMGRYGISMDVAPIEEELEFTEFDDDGYPTRALYHLVKGMILGATGTPFPAIGRAFLEFVEVSDDGQAPDGGDAPGDTGGEGDEGVAAAGAAAAGTGRRPAPVVAGAAPARPPAEWFTDPEFGTGDDDGRLVRQRDGRYACPLTIDEGPGGTFRVFGHLARWGQCHIGFEDACVTPPNSPSGYAHFRLGQFQAAGRDGLERLAIGTLTFDTGHADRRLNAADATAHYDHSGTQGAFVVTGEDEHGIWYAGALRPGLSDEQLTRIAALSISGDWRSIGGELELVAALMVNVPGFPIVRLTAAGGPAALLAAGVVERPTTEQLLATELADTRRRLATLERAVAPILHLGGDPLDARMAALR